MLQLSMQYSLPAATTHVIIVSHINIKHQLLLQSLEGPRLDCVVLIWLRVKK